MKKLLDLPTDLLILLISVFADFESLISAMQVNKSLYKLTVPVLKGYERKCIQFLREESPFRIPDLYPFIPYPHVVQSPHFSVDTSECAGIIINKLILKATESCLNCDELIPVVSQVRQAQYSTNDLDGLLAKMDSILLQDLDLCLIQPDLMDQLGRIYFDETFVQGVKVVDPYNEPFNQLSTLNKITFIILYFNPLSLKFEVLVRSAKERLSALSDLAQTKAVFNEQVTQAEMIANAYFVIASRLYQIIYCWIVQLLYNGYYESAMMWIWLVASSELVNLVLLFVARGVVTFLPPFFFNNLNKQSNPSGQ